VKSKGFLADKLVKGTAQNIGGAMLPGLNLGKNISALPPTGGLMAQTSPREQKKIAFEEGKGEGKTKGEGQATK
jgi:hypothetical protein